MFSNATRRFATPARSASFHCVTNAMSQHKKSIIEVQGTVVTILSGQQEDYISLTDIAVTKIVNERITSSKTGCAIETRLSSWAFGSG
jgi:hypothetical protein